MNNQAFPHPILFLVSAPSGAGKTTLCKRLMEAHPELKFSVSATTRAPREGERNGVDYHFMSEADFLEQVEQGFFLEYAQVHNHYYGTPLQPLLAQYHQGHSILLDVDVQGGRLIRKALREVEAASELAAVYVDVFISPPSIDALRERLQGRGKDAEDVIARRLNNAVEELEASGEYAYQVLNDELEVAYRNFESVYRSGTLRTMPL